MRFFKTIVTIFSRNLPAIPSVTGMPCSEDAVFGGHYTQTVSESEMPEKCRDFFQAKPVQLKLFQEDQK